MSLPEIVPATSSCVAGEVFPTPSEPKIYDDPPAMNVRFAPEIVDFEVIVSFTMSEPEILA